MPLITIQTSLGEIPNAKIFLQDLSKDIGSVLGKSEKYVMASIIPNLTMTFSGDTSPSCYVELKSIGQISTSMTNELSILICNKISKDLGVNGDRIYIQFESVRGELWGWDGRTFA